MRKKSISTKLAISGVLIAIGVILGSFYIPVLGSKMSPIQHFINVVAAVVLGPLYGVGCAFATSIFRNILGTGSLLAFPGSMIGALLSGVLYKKFNNIEIAAIGEVFGTGVLGAIIAYPVSSYLLGKEVAVLFYVFPFILSSFGGSIIAYVLLKVKNIRNILVSIKE